MRKVSEIVDDVLVNSLPIAKQAAKWEDLSYEAQKKYLQQHRKSKKKMTAKPGQGGADVSDLKEGIEEKRKDMSVPTHKVELDVVGEDEAKAIAKKHGLDAPDITDIGNTYSVVFSGSKDDLEKLIRDYADDDADDIEFYNSLIEENKEQPNREDQERYEMDQIENIPSRM